MSKPDLFPKTTTAGIAVDPRTLERVIPESRRSDGSVRKQLKVRPGFTPQEDINRFRGTKQAQMDANVLPKGHIIGWAPPPTSTANSSTSAAKSKSAKKNEKRKEKRKEKVSVDTEKVKDSWEDEDEEDSGAKEGAAAAAGVHTVEKPNWAAAAPDTKENLAVKQNKAKGVATADELTEKLEKLNVR